MVNVLPAEEPLPVANRPATIWGVSISIQILAVAAVAFRLFARSKLRHGFGLDDLFVVLACVVATIGTVIIALQPATGLGKHQLSLSLKQLAYFLQLTLGSVLAYTLSVTFIKISILFQYIRLAGHERILFRRLCWLMIFLCAAWGIVFFFIIVFGCIPISAYWNPFQKHHCMLFGSLDGKVKLQGYIAQSASNMVLDLIVFAMPLYVLHTTRLSRRSQIGLLGVFAVGASVVIISILRLASIASSGLGLTDRIMDVTYRAPMTIIWSCIEANVAVLCASVPVFWPVLTKLGFGKIMVTNEVEVRSEHRLTRFFVHQSDDEDQELTQNLGWRDASGKVEIGKDFRGT